MKLFVPFLRTLLTFAFQPLLPCHQVRLLLSRLWNITCHTTSGRLFLSSSSCWGLRFSIAPDKRRKWIQVRDSHCLLSLQGTFRCNLMIRLNLIPKNLSKRAQLFIMFTGWGFVPSPQGLRKLPHRRQAIIVSLNASGSIHVWISIFACLVLLARESCEQGAD